LLNVYKTTFYPFVSQTCKNCHISGPGIGTFASTDVNASFTSFMSIGSTLISSQAVNDNHKPPYTGSQNQGIINSINAAWGPAQTAYASCVAEHGGGTSSAYVVKSNNMQVPAKLSTTFVRMEWDLETQSSAKVPLVGGIDIRLSVIGGVNRGYEFRNPTLRLKSTAKDTYTVSAINLYLNNNLQTEITTYANVTASITTMTDLNLSPGTANALDAVTAASTDMIAIEFETLKSSSGTPNPGTTPTSTPTPTPTVTPVQMITWTQLTAAGGVIAQNCAGCHGTSVQYGGLNLLNYTAAKTAAPNIRSRVTNSNNPMPPTGLLPTTQQNMIVNWIDQGANQ
jgi:hypothetical protein